MALDLRKQDEEYKQLHSQVVQQIADRFYEAKKRFMDGLARFPRQYGNLFFLVKNEMYEIQKKLRG